MLDGHLGLGGQAGGLASGARVVVACGATLAAAEGGGTAHELTAALARRCGLPAGRVTVVAAPTGSIDVAVAVARAAPTATDTLLVYWLGPVDSGPVASGSADDPLLVTYSASGVASGATTLPLADLLALVSASPATRRAVVVDGWRTGRAGSSGADQAARIASIAREHGPDVEILFSVAAVERTATTEPPAPASARIVELLDNGDPDEPAELTLGRLHDLVADSLAREVAGWALRVPAVWADEFVVARNLARVAALERRAAAPTTILSDGARTVPVPDAHVLAPAFRGTPECPYPGLVSFDAGWERFFFGRAETVADALARLAERAAGAGPLVLVGASGSGKSSLLRAGMLPAVARGALGAVLPAGSPQVVLTPTERPLAELVSQVAQAAGSPALAWVLRDAVRGDPGRFPEILADLTAPATDGDARGRRLVIAVDQFEEVFTLCSDEGERVAFVRALCAAATSRSPARPGGDPPPAVVVLAVRGDFYLHCAAYPELANALQTGQVVVGAMSRAEVRDAVVEPARAVGLELEPALVELMLNDLGTDDDDATDRGRADAGSLPLLAHALRVTWGGRVGRTLTVAGYRATGRLAGALAKTADDLFTGLDAAGQQAARSLLLRLVRVGDGGEVTRRPMRREALLAEVPEPAAPAVLDELVASRLVEADADRVQIAHEALLRSWPRLRDWIELDRAGALVRQQLDDGGQEWERHGRDPSFLIGGLRLAAAREWVEAGERRRSLGGPAGEFYDASLAHEQGAARENRRRTRRLRMMVAGLTVLVLLAAGVTVFAFQQRSAVAQARDRADGERDRAQSAQIAAVAADLRDTDPEVGAQFALAALDVADTPEARSAVLGAATSTRQVGEHEGAIGAVAYSPDGTQVATGGDDGIVHVWDMTDPLHGHVVGSLPRDVTDGKPNAVRAVAFNPDGSLLATGTSNGFVRVWDLADRAKPVLRATLPQTSAVAAGGTFGLSFSSQADLLAVGGYGNAARLYDLTAPDQPQLTSDLQGHSKPVNAVAFSPDGTLIVTGSDDGTAALWNVTSPRAPTSLGTLPPPYPDVDLSRFTVGAVGFSPGGTGLAVVYDEHGDGYSQSYLEVFNVPPGSGSAKLATSTSTSGFVLDLAYLDEQAIAVVAADTFVEETGAPAEADAVAVRILEPNRANGNYYPLASVLHPDGVRAVAAHPSDGRGFVTGAEDGALRWARWDGAVLGDGNAYLLATASSSGRLVATATDTNQLLLYDVDPAGEDPARFRGRATTSAGYAHTVVFGADDQVLAVASTAVVELWDVSGAAVERWDTSPIIDPNQSPYDEFGNPVRAPGGPVPLSTVAAAEGQEISSTDLSSDGRRLAVGGDSGEVAIWDVSDPRAPKLVANRKDAHGAAPVRAAFSPDGRLLATTSDDGLLKLWNVDDLDGNPVGTADLADTPKDLAFSPSGRLVAVVGASRVAHLVDTSDPAAVREVGTTTPSPRLLDAVSFSPAGDRLLVGGGSDIRYWDVTAPDAPKRLADLAVPGPYYGLSLYDLSFLADGEHAILGVGYVVAPVLDLDVQAKAERLCTYAGDGITEEEWNAYLPGFDYTPPCRP